MNGEKKKQMDKKQMILLGIYGVSVVAFLVSLLLLGVLPVTYLLGIVLVLGGTSFLLIKGLFGKEKGKKKRKKERRYANEIWIWRRSGRYDGQTGFF